MKVIYKKTVLQKIFEAKDEAGRLGKQIDHIQLEPREYYDLMADEGIRQFLRFDCPRSDVNIAGVSVRRDF